MTICRFLPRSAALGALLTGIVVGTGAAHGTPEDNDNYLRELRHWGVPMSTGTEMIQIAQAICGLRRSGYSLGHVVGLLEQNPSFGEEYAPPLYYSATLYYCPEYN